MLLFTGSSPDNLVRRVRGNGLSKIAEPATGDFWDKDFSANHVANGVDNQLNAVFEGQVKTGHFRIGNRQGPCSALLEEKGDHTASRANDIAVADHRKAGFIAAAVAICGDKNLIRA